MAASLNSVLETTSTSTMSTLMSLARTHSTSTVVSLAPEFTIKVTIRKSITEFRLADSFPNLQRYPVQKKMVAMINILLIRIATKRSMCVKKMLLTVYIPAPRHLIRTTRERVISP